MGSQRAKLVEGEEPVRYLVSTSSMRSSLASLSGWLSSVQVLAFWK